MKLLFFIFPTIFFLGCTISDPYNPLMGPRNPRPGAEKYLSERNDISKGQKSALLNYQPCSRETLQVLADAASPEVRSLVAANPAVDESILEKFITDKESGVRQYVASNPKSPKAILLKLQNDSDESVKWSLERNPNWKANKQSDL